MSKYGVFSGPYFPTFGLNMERYGVSLCIQSECGKIQARKNSVFAHFSRSDSKMFILGKVATSCTKEIAVIACRKFSEILGRSTLENSYHKIPVVKFVLIKLQRWILDLHFAE